MSWQLIRAWRVVCIGVFLLKFVGGVCPRAYAATRAERINRKHRRGLWPVRLVCGLLLATFAFTIYLPHMAKAQTSCPGLPGSFGATNQTWYFDTDAGTCTNGGAPPVNGFLISTYDAFLFIVQMYTFGLANGLFNNAGDYTTHNVSPVTISPDSGGTIGFVNTVGSSTYRLVFNNGAAPATERTFTISFSKAGISYTIVLVATFKDATNTQDITSITITGGAFGSPSLGPNAQQRSSVATSLQNSINSVTPSVLGTSGLDLRGAGAAGTGVTFAPTGLSFGSVDPANPMDRDYGPAAAPWGYFAQFAGSRHRNDGFNFSINLQQMAANARKRDRDRAKMFGMDQESARDGPDQLRSRWVPSVSGRYVDFDDGQSGADRNGHLWYVTSALGYRLSDRTTAGVFTRHRRGKVDSVALDSSLDSELWGGGVYLSVKGSSGLRFIGAALYETGENDIVISGATGDFGSETVTLEASLDKRLRRGRHWIEPQARLLYYNSDNDDFTDSAGNFVTGETNVLGRLTYGPRIGTTLHRGRLTFDPYAKVQGMWDFENEDDATVSTGALLKAGDHAITLGGGLGIRTAGGLAIRVAGDWFAYDTKLEGWSVTGGIGGSFAAFGLADVAPGGSLSLDFTGNRNDASALARVRIPLGGED